MTPTAAPVEVRSISPSYSTRWTACRAPIDDQSKPRRNMAALITSADPSDWEPGLHYQKLEEDLGCE